MKISRAQIVATIGPASATKETLMEMLKNQMSIARLNFAWSDREEKGPQIALLKEIAKELNMRIPIIEDLPGPRIQGEHGHTYDKIKFGFTAHDEELARFGVEHGVDYIALSFVRSAKEIKACREVVRRFSGNQKIIAKVECLEAVEAIDEIIAEADAVMIARGDLGNEVPLEKIPFVQDMIIKKCKKA